MLSWSNGCGASQKFQENNRLLVSTQMWLKRLKTQLAFKASPPRGFTQLPVNWPSRGHFQRGAELKASNGPSMSLSASGPDSHVPSQPYVRGQQVAHSNHTGHDHHGEAQPGDGQSNTQTNKQTKVTVSQSKNSQRHFLPRGATRWQTVWMVWISRCWWPSGSVSVCKAQCNMGC